MRHVISRIFYRALDSIAVDGGFRQDVRRTRRQVDCRPRSRLRIEDVLHALDALFAGHPLHSHIKREGIVRFVGVFHDVADFGKMEKKA